MAHSAARLELERGCDLEDQGQFKLAIKHYLKAARLGSPEAQVNLANLYDEGTGCEKNLEQAVYWYKRAVKLGSPQAANNLAQHYRQLGKLRWARYWLDRAAQMGYESV